MSEKTIKNILISIGVIFMIIFSLSPFLYMLIVSFSKNPFFLSPQIDFAFTFQNYYAILTVKSLHFIDYLKNSLIVSATGAFFSVLIASLSAYSITRLSFPGKVLILFVILSISMFPQISIIGYLFKLMSYLGLINTYSALILPYIAWSLPLSLWILISYFSQIPQDLDKAGLVDGASRWQVLFKIILPVSLPGIFSTALLAFIFCFNDFIFALMLTVDYRARTVPVGIALFQGLHGEIPWGNIMAASTITTLPIVILTLIFQKYIIQGLTRGAIKG